MTDNITKNSLSRHPALVAGSLRYRNKYGMTDNITKNSLSRHPALVTGSLRYRNNN